MKTVKDDLTPKQQRLPAYLHDALAETGGTPSLREAGVARGVSHNLILQLLQQLERTGYIKREGRYSRKIYLLNRANGLVAAQRSREIPIIGRIAAGLPLYGQQEWDGAIVVDGEDVATLRTRETQTEITVTHNS